MSDFRDVTFGEHLFSRIDDNAYLQKLYHNILINYSKRLFRLDEMEDQPVNIGDALTFADVLSKSCFFINSVLLSTLFPINSKTLSHLIQCVINIFFL